MITEDEWNALDLDPERHSHYSYVLRFGIIASFPVVIRPGGFLELNMRYRVVHGPYCDVKIGSYDTPEEAEAVALTLRLTL